MSHEGRMLHTKAARAPVSTKIKERSTSPFQRRQYDRVVKRNKDLAEKTDRNKMFGIHPKPEERSDAAVTTSNKHGLLNAVAIVGAVVTMTSFSYLSPPPAVSQVKGNKPAIAAVMNMGGEETAVKTPEAANGKPPEAVKGKAPVDANPFTVEFDGKNVNIKNFTTSNGKYSMDYSVFLTKLLIEITGKSQIDPKEAEIKRLDKSVSVVLSNGVIFFTPNGDTAQTSTTRTSTARTDGQITEKYYDTTNDATLAVSNKGELLIFNSFVKLNLDLKKLYKREIGILTLTPDKNNSDLVFVNENGKPILVIHTNAINDGTVLERYPPMLGSLR